MQNDDPQPQGSRLQLAPGIYADESAIRIQFSRSGGPGGQNVNKVNTRVQLWIPLSAIVGLTESATVRLKTLAGSKLTITNELLITAETERTQERNRQAVYDRLKLLVDMARIEPKRRRKTKPSRGAKQRRLTGKKIRSEIKARRQGRD